MKKIITIFLYFALSFTSAQSLIKVDITRGNLDPLPIAVSPLYVESGSKEIKQDGKVIKDVGKEILSILNLFISRFLWAAPLPN